MKKFAFRLQSVMNVKIALEKQKRNEMERAAAYLEQCRQAVAALEEEHYALAVKFQEEARAGIHAQRMYAYSAYFDDLKHRTDIERMRVVRAEKELQMARTALVEAMREVKIFEKLKEKQYEEYLVEVARENDKIIDDFVSYQTAFPNQ